VHLLSGPHAGIERVTDEGERDAEDQPQHEAERGITGCLRLGLESVPARADDSGVGTLQRLEGAQLLAVPRELAVEPGASLALAVELRQAGIELALGLNDRLGVQPVRNAGPLHGLPRHLRDTSKARLGLGNTNRIRVHRRNIGEVRGQVPGAREEDLSRGLVDLLLRA
jgi:hypothetical protein